MKLGVNIDHAATLRQLRQGTTSYPNLVELVKKIKKSGGDQITIHLREDRRHIQDQDVKVLCARKILPINLEMAATEEMVSIALKNRPAWVCFVPEKRKELTTEGGLDVVRKKKFFQKNLDRLFARGIQVSMFIEPLEIQVLASAQLGASAVEFHTGSWVLLKGSQRSKEWKKLQRAAKLAHHLGMRVHAGHGLDLISCRQLMSLPFLEEVNIGHSIICYSLDWGVENTIKKFTEILR